MKKAITLVGIMGSGKTSIAKKLAKKLNLTCIDTDLKIKEITNYSVLELISLNKKDLLNQTELNILKQYSNEKYIISTGDDTINNSQAWHFILDNTITIWINIKLKYILERLRPTENRPLLNNTTQFTIKDLQSLYIKRKKFYKQCHIELRNLKKQSIEKLVETLKIPTPNKMIIQ